MIGFTEYHGWGKDNGSDGEKSPKVRTLVGVMLTLAGLGVYRSIQVADSDNTGLLPFQSGASPEIAIGDTNTRLEIGDRITDKNLLIPTDGKSQKITLDLKTNLIPKDSKIIYSPEVSKSLLNINADPDKTDAVGFLLTEGAKKMDLSFVLFDTKTKVIEAITPAIQINQNTELLFQYINQSTNLGSKVYAEQINSGQQAIIFFEGVSMHQGTSSNGLQLS